MYTQVEQVQECQQALEGWLTEGVLTADSLLDKEGAILACLRACNATLRWAMLHRNSRNKKVRDTVCAAIEPEGILLLLLHTAQLEFRVTALYKELLAGKAQRWHTARQECAARMYVCVCICIYIHTHTHVCIGKSVPRAWRSWRSFSPGRWR